jgi:hypothetical protein
MRKLIVIFSLCIEVVFAQNIKENIFGFATSNTFTYCDVTDTSFLYKVIALQPKLLRFPGGAVGNFYHYGEKGYGFDFFEIDQYHDGKFPKRSRGLDKSRNKKNQQQDYIEDFIVLAKKTNAKAVLVANLFIDNDDILLMIKKLTENNIEVVGIELGSELSNRSYFTKGYTIDEYIIAAKKCSAKIKNKYPYLKTAIVVAPLGKRKGHRHNIWNEKLAKLNFYDAIIIHSYAKVTKGEDRYGQMISEENEGKNKREAFDTYKDRAIDYLVNKYPKEVKVYEGIFHKPIWVTEWNLQMSKTTGNTLLQSLFVAHYLLELISNSDLSAIELTTYHNLGGRDFSASVFRSNKEEIEIQSTYYPMAMVGKIFESDIDRIERNKYNDCFIYTCYDSKGIKKFIFSIDWEDNILKLQTLSKFNKHIFDVIEYKGDDLFDKANIKGILELDTSRLIVD